jgi:hypothetical protein
LERVVGRQNELLAELQHQVSLIDAKDPAGASYALFVEEYRAAEAKPSQLIRGG